MVLLQVRHLGHRGRQALLDAALVEVRWVERDLVGDLLAVFRSEPPAGEIPVGALAALHGDKARRQPPAEQPPIEKHKGVIERLIDLGGRVGCAHGLLSPDYVSYGTEPR